MRKLKEDLIADDPHLKLKILTQLVDVQYFDRPESVIIGLNITYYHLETRLTYDKLEALKPLVRQVWSENRWLLGMIYKHFQK